jgi:chloramphenicol 3-O-phosphotransferase
MPRGTIILLNGTASAGKTSIGQAIQRLADRPWLLLGLDLLATIVPPPYNGGAEAATGFAWQPAGPDELALVAGPWGQHTSPTHPGQIWSAEGGTGYASAAGGGWDRRRG